MTLSPKSSALAPGTNSADARTPDRKMLFAPLIRVSTEQQKRQGESLRTQKEQLSKAVEALGGEVYKWYEGQEHATPEFERRILEQLMQDAQARKFDAVIVADLSRWSRDNGKSKHHTKILQKSGIRFFEGAREINLFDPTQAFVLGMGVEIAEFFASQQTYKSVINRIARAKQGGPACGKRPYGRVWDKEAKIWKADPEKQAKIQKIGKIYLESDISFNDLGPRFGMNGAALHKTLCHRCGDTWEQRFISKRHGIDETVIIKIPRLLPEETIQAIRKKSEARNSWDKKGQKHPYLFARVIFDMDTGKALTGTCNRWGQRYYRPYWGYINRYSINAAVLEKAVLEDLFLALGSKASLQQAVFDGHPMGKVADKIKVDLESKRSELKGAEKQIENYLTAIGTSNDVMAFMNRIKPKLAELEAKSKNLKDEIVALEYRLASLPDEAEIEARRDKWAGLLKRQMRSYLQTGVALHQLPFEAQKKIIRLIFGGKDEMGQRYGIYVKDLGGTPKRYQFEAYGKLGAVTGWIEAKTGAFSSDSDSDLLMKKDDNELAEGISRVMLDANPAIIGDNSRTKVHMLSERHAHYGQRLHQ